MRIWSTNADVLTNIKLLELKSQITNNAPEIIAVSEVKPKNSKRNLSLVEDKLPGYSAEHESLLVKDKSRGIIVYIHNSVKYERIDLRNVLKEGSSIPREIVVCEIELVNSEKMLFCCIYRSPNSSRVNNDCINDTILQLSDLGYKHFVVVGDINYKHIDWDSVCAITGEDEENFVNTIQDAFLTQFVTVPTRARGSAEPSILDLFMYNVEDSLDYLFVDNPLGKSDHAVVKGGYRCSAEQMPPKTRCCYEKADFEKMQNMMNLEWEEVFKECKDDVDSQIKIFLDIFYEAEKKCVPKKVVHVGSNRFSYPLDKKALSKKRKKYRLWKRYLESKDGQVYAEYRRASNQLRSLTRKAAKIYEKGVAMKSKANCKTFWKYASSKTKLRSDIPNLYMDSENMTENDTEKANVLGGFFAKVQTKEPDWIWELPEKPEPKFKIDFEITEDIILKKLQKLKIAKSPGPDGLHPRVIKELMHVLVKPFAIIFQTSINTGTLPQEWKMSNITAIYKKGDKHDPGNYRPVSLTSIMCRTLESIIRDAMLKYLKKNGLISKKQFGFLQGRSTVLQLLKVIDKWTEILDRGGCIDVIYMDFMKAFDTVPHNRLMHVLESYGIGGPLLTWIQQFLTGRKQRVVVSGQTSQWYDVISGVPQGSVLGPVLFVVYINTMLEVTKAEDIYLFADDTKLFKEISSVEDIYDLQTDVDGLYDWTLYSFLRFHPNKCTAMRVTRGDTDAHGPCSYNMNEVRLKNSCEETDLGLIIDSRLTFEQHIMSKVKKANSVVGLIRRTFSYLDSDMFKTLFTSIVRPIVEYAAPVWNPYLCKHINALEKIQERATKMVPGLDKDYEKRLRKLKLPTLAYRRYRGDMLEMYKMTHKKYDEEALGDFMQTSQSHSRGHPYNVYKLRYGHDIRKYSFRLRVQSQWNNLPVKVVTAPSINSFKGRLDKLWRGSDLMYNPKVKVHVVSAARNTRYTSVSDDDQPDSDLMQEA